MVSSLRKLLPILALALVAVPLTAQADVSNDEEAKKLSDRSSPRYNVAVPGASIRAGGSMVLVNAPMATVRKVVTDYGKYQTVMPRFQKSRVVSKKDGKTDVYLQVPILHGAATVWALTRFEQPTKEGTNGERIEGKMVEGNVDDLRAIWHLRPVDDTHTILKLELLIVPKLPLPGSVVTPELEYAADQAVVSARTKAESKAGDETAQK
jgi:ribosome-associated toxin RatA of RatAB toxin-antitoxin module